MARVLQRNPDGSMLVEEDPKTTELDITTGTMVPLAAPVPGRKFILRQDPLSGDFVTEPFQDAAPVAPEAAAPPDISQYAVPAASAPDAATASPSLGASRTQLKTSSQVTQTGTPEERNSVLAQVDEGGRQQLAGIEKASQLGQERAIEEASVVAKGLELQEDLMGMQVQKDRIRQQRLDRASQQLQGTLDSLEKTDVDPNRFYARMDTGSQIAAGLAIGLGAVGQALMNLPDNPAMSAINRAIDRDIEAQKMDIEKQRGKATIASSIYSQMRDQFADDRSATEATRAAMLKLVDVRLQKIAATTKNKELAAQAQTMSGKINEDIAKTKGSILKELADKITVDQTVSPVDATKNLSEIRQAIKDNPQIKKYVEARQGLREFEIAKKSGALGAGVISFVANGLSQGSFGPEMLRMLDWATIPQRVEDALRMRFGGAEGGNLARKLTTFLTAQEASMRAELKPQFDYLDQLAKQSGAPGLESFIAVGPLSKLDALTKGRKRVNEAP
jgi:hypothetical protein